MKNKQRDGTRKGAGRKAEVTGVERINVSLDPATVKKARDIALGNLSLGLRMAVKAMPDK